MLSRFLVQCSSSEVQGRATEILCISGGGLVISSGLLQSLVDFAPPTQGQLLDIVQTIRLFFAPFKWDDTYLIVVRTNRLARS